MIGAYCILRLDNGARCFICAFKVKTRRSTFAKVGWTTSMCGRDEARDVCTGRGTDVTDRRCTRDSRQFRAWRRVSALRLEKNPRCLESGSRNLAIVSAIAQTIYRILRDKTKKSPYRVSTQRKTRDRFCKLVFIGRNVMHFFEHLLNSYINFCLVTEK